MLVYQRLRENCSGKVLKGKQMVDLTKNGGWNHPQDMVEKKLHPMGNVDFHQLWGCNGHI